MAAREHRQGFTLLEMMVALALMAIIAGSLYASLHVGFKARNGVEATLGPVRRAHLALDLVRKDVEAALPPTGILAGEFLGQDLAGEAGRDADTLLLHASGRATMGQPSACDVRRVELALSLSPGEDVPALVRRTTVQLLAPEAPAPVEEVLCRGVSAFNLRYFDGTQWLDAWDSTVQGNLLPVAVELTIELDRSAARQTQSAGYTATCVFVLPCGKAGTTEANAAAAGSGT